MSQLSVSSQLRKVANRVPDNQVELFCIVMILNKQHLCVSCFLIQYGIQPINLRFFLPSFHSSFLSFVLRSSGKYNIWGTRLVVYRKVTESKKADGRKR